MIVHQRHGPVALLRIDRPDAANSLDGASRTALIKAFDDCEADDSVRAVVITGGGDRVFCAGLDMREMPADFDLATGVADRVGRSPLPTIAAVNGAAVGGGFELVLACDLVIAAEHARFWLPEVTRGMVPTDGGTRLSQRLPFAIAMELVLTAAELDAERALALGLINQVVPGRGLTEAALELAMTTSRGAPQALASAKQLVRRSLSDSAAELRTAESDVSRRVLASDEAREGTQAFLAGRPPDWANP